jgi:tRNA dimethylallyltransferase
VAASGAVAIVGTTASGKSALALEVAQRLGGLEIVSVDSMQVYRELDIGTAKPSADDRAAVPHHLIDVADPDEDFTVARYQRLARQALADNAARGGRALLVGGTGLYLRAVVDGLTIPGRFPELAHQLDGDPDTDGLHRRLTELDPAAAARIEPGNRRRLVRALEVTLGSGQRFSSFGPGLETYRATDHVLLGIDLPPDVVARRIEERFHRQLASGFLAEVAALADRPSGLSRTARQALGYKELLAHLAGAWSLDEAVDVAIRRTRRFARRQRAWFRRDPRIRWLGPVDDPSQLLPALHEAVGQSVECS